MKTLLFSILICCSMTCYSQQVENTPQLSPQAEISAITLGPWQGEVYSAFGHSAFRVYDPSQNIDAFFNYGVFSFNVPNFYLKFARGHLNYKLDVDPYTPWKDHYISYNRFVHEQILNLTQAQKQKVFDYLYWNMQPGNEYYMYDYFYDNCATKLRDVLKASLKNDIRFDSSFITTHYTIRQLTDIYLVKQPWGDLGIDICLGLPMDKKASPFEYMFLPDYIEASFNHAQVRRDETMIPLVKEDIAVYESHPEETEPALIHPWVAFGALLFVTCLACFFDWRRNKLSKWFDCILFGVVGLVGLLLLLLWVATDHRAAARNMNLLWAMPLHLIFVPLYLKGSKKAGTYFQIIAVVNLLTLLTWAWLPQQLNVFLIPVVAALGIRAALIGYMWRDDGYNRFFSRMKKMSEHKEVSPAPAP